MRHPSRLRHLPRAKRGCNPNSAMDIARTLLVALVALSVALLPVAGASARAVAQSGAHVAAQSDCCPQGQDCDKWGKGECGKSASCALKCSGVFAASLTSSEVTPALTSAAQQSGFVSEAPTSRSSNPPLPPPRV